MGELGQSGPFYKQRDMQADRRTDGQRRGRGCGEEWRESARRRQKAYKVLAMMSEALTGPLRCDWQCGQGAPICPGLAFAFVN